MSALGSGRRAGVCGQRSCSPPRGRSASSEEGERPATAGARPLKKRCGHLFAPVAERFACIETHRKEYRVSMMCRVLDVSVSGYYAWRKRPVCVRKREDGELSRRISQIFTAHRRVYGSPRIQAELRAQGICCGRKRIARLMRQAQLCARPRAARGRATHRDPTASARVAPNGLNREFTAPAASAEMGG